VTTTRLPLAAAITAAVMGAAAMLLWRHTAAVAYIWFNVLPPSFWALAAIGAAHWRQMEAHRSAALTADGHRAVAAAAHAEARTARKIMADLYKHQTGLHHPAAPREGV
jgi:hypothetical protein